VTILYWCALILALLLFIAPVVAYLCTKYAVYGYLKAKERFRQDSEEGQPLGDSER
jgi:hypothetical protein